MRGIFSYVFELHIAESTMEEQLQLSSFCHANNIALIVASTKGLFGQIFCDFGEDFEIVDTNGENPSSAMVAGITKEVNS